MKYKALLMSVSIQMTSSGRVSQETITAMADAIVDLDQQQASTKGQYSESLVRRNQQLEKALEIHKLELERLEGYCRELRYDILILRQKVSPDDSTGETVWHWQHDGYDNLSSMRSGQAVLIGAEDLRDLLTNGEINEDGERIKPNPIEVNDNDC